jgi:hypothetical protein
MKAPNPWHPMTDAVDVKHLGKLAEELAECGASVARCIIQGIDETEPVTGKINRQWLQEEMSDVLANIMLVQERFGLNSLDMALRMKQKMDHLRAWHELA